MTAPTTTTRCAVALRVDAPTLESGGGSGTLTVTTNRECTWEAASEADWLTLSSRTGQGDATLTYVAGSNPQPSVRRGGLVVNGVRSEITQAAAPCEFALSATVATVGPGGGPATVGVTAAAGCAWTAVSQVPWVEVVSGGAGNGSGGVTLAVAGNDGEARTGAVIIAGRPFTVAQGAAAPVTPPVAGCTYEVPSTVAMPTGGGTTTIPVGTSGTCAWSATSDAPWIVVAPPGAGQGPGALTITVAANTSTTVRTGTVVVAGRAVLVAQDAAPLVTPPVTLPPTTPPPGPPAPPPVGCTVTVTPTSQGIAATGGTAVFSVNAPAGCAWTSTSATPWLTVVGAAGGEGAGFVTLSAPANAETVARSGTATVAGQLVQVTQAAAPATPTPTPCTFSVAPTTVSAGASATSVIVSVTASGSTCTWTAASPTPWLMPSPATGTGNGQVSLAIAANDATAARSGLLSLAGATVQVTQAGAAPPAPEPCTFTVSPTSLVLPSGGGGQPVQVTASAGSCQWTATSPAPWLSVAGGGAGSGVVDVRAGANDTTAARSATLTIAGRSVAVTQEAPAPPAPTPCTFAVAPDTQRMSAEGGEASVTVEASADACAWTASATVPWIQLIGGAPGTGSGRVTYSVAPNESTSPRTGTLVVAGRTVTVTQDAAAPPVCNHALVPSSLAFDAAGGEGATRLDTGPTCAWTAVSAASWITVLGPASGTGSAEVRVAVAANDSAAGRSGSMRVGDAVLQVTQAGAEPPRITFDGRAAMVGGSCPLVQFRVEGQRVYADGATRFEGASCSALRNGTAVRGEGRLQPDGRVLATRIEIVP